MNLSLQFSAMQRKHTSSGPQGSCLQQGSRPVSRRGFLRRVVAGTAGVTFPWVIPARVLGGAGRTPPSEKINLACIGVGGMGAANIEALAPYCNIVALCDVDERHAGATFAKYPSARRYKDFRRMFEEMADRFEAVLVATPDHTHAVASMMAIKPESLPTLVGACSGPGNGRCC